MGHGKADVNLKQLMAFKNDFHCIHLNAFDYCVSAHDCYWTIEYEPVQH